MANRSHRKAADRTCTRIDPPDEFPLSGRSERQINTVLPAGVTAAITVLAIHGLRWY